MTRSAVRAVAGRACGRRRVPAYVIAFACVLMLAPGGAVAFSVAAFPSFPETAVVGDQNLSGLVLIQAGAGGATICNAGEAGTCLGSEGITLTPSCGGLTTFPGCDAADPGVFRIDSPAHGAAGTACASTTFTVAVISAATGQVRFTPDLGDIVLPATDAACRIDFTFDVVRIPATDGAPAFAGVQTYQLAQASASGGGAGGGSSAVTVKAAPAITAAPSPGVALGGSISDSISLSRAHNPTTGSVSFRSFGPDDAGCTGAGAFSVTMPINANGTATSPPFVPAAPGAYRWIVTYAGDDSNVPATSACVGGNETVVGPPDPQCADCDGDRYPSIVDCDDHDAAVHPGATDTPANKRDEDCSGHDAAYRRVDARFSYRFQRFRRFTRFTSLHVRGAGAGSTIRLSCSGKGCTFKRHTRTLKRDAADISLTRLVKRMRLRPRAQLEVRVTTSGRIGLARRFTVRAGADPTEVERCIAPGTTRSAPCGS